MIEFDSNAGQTGEGFKILIQCQKCDSGSCINTAGSYHCNCNTGYQKSDNTCVDINECNSFNYCVSNGECINTSGSYRCSCESGYYQEGSNCADIDECITDDRCQSNEQCVNTSGSYICSSGYKKMKF